MAFLNEVVFVLIGLITLGMTVNAWSLYAGTSEAKPTRFLMLAFLLADLTCVLTLGTALSPVFLTLFNTCLLFTIWACAMTARSWHTALTQRFIRLTGGAMLLIPVVFEYMRQHHSYVDRVMFYTLVSSALMLWALFEVMQRYRQDKAFQLKFMMGVILCGLGLRVARMVFVLQQTNHPDNLMQESMWPAMLRNTSVSMDVLVLSSLLAYSTYLLAWRYQKSTADNQAVREAHQKLELALQEKEQMLKALTIATKTRNMGVVLASVAHELNQPLTALRLKTEFLLSQSALPAAERETWLAEMVHDNARAAGIVAELRRFLSQGSSEMQSIALDRILQDALDMLSTELKRPDLNVELHIQPQVGVQGVESQLQMVVLNLLKNALDAAQTVPAPHHLRVSLSSNQETVRLEVSDNGPGVPDALQERVFDMFFSTKAEGMGLGLWLSRAIMHKHGGTMSVARSDLGGACFTLTWPLP